MTNLKPRWISIVLICTLAASSVILASATIFYYAESRQLSQTNEQLSKEYQELGAEYGQLNRTYFTSVFFNHSGFPPSPEYAGIQQILISYPGGFQEYAYAILEIIERSLTDYAWVFGMSSPDVHLFIYTNASSRSLSTTPQNYRIYPYVSSIWDMEPPSISGLHHVYGFIHEIAHVMFTTDNPNFNEGWAYYAAGFRIVPEVYRSLGNNAWPKPYNYSQTEGRDRFLSEINNSTLTQPSSIRAASKILYMIDQKYGPTLFKSAMNLMHPDYAGMYRYPVYSLTEFKTILADLTNDANILQAFSENGF